VNASSLSAFDEKSIIPDDSMVSIVLGNASSVWDELHSYIEDKYPDITGEWKHYGKAAG